MRKKFVIFLVILAALVVFFVWRDSISPALIEGPESMFEGPPPGPPSGFKGPTEPPPS